MQQLNAAVRYRINIDEAEIKKQKFFRFQKDWRRDVQQKGNAVLGGKWTYTGRKKQFNVILRFTKRTERIRQNFENKLRRLLLILCLI